MYFIFKYEHSKCWHFQSRTYTHTHPWLVINNNIINLYVESNNILYFSK